MNFVFAFLTPHAPESLSPVAQFYSNFRLCPLFLRCPAGFLLGVPCVGALSGTLSKTALLAHVYFHEWSLVYE